MKSITRPMHDDPDKVPVLMQSVKGVLAGLLPAKNADG